jgi:hypothetical protein
MDSYGFLRIPRDSYGFLLRKFRPSLHPNSMIRNMHFWGQSLRFLMCVCVRKVRAQF